MSAITEAKCASPLRRLDHRWQELCDFGPTSVAMPSSQVNDDQYGAETYLECRHLPWDELVEQLVTRFPNLAGKSRHLPKHLKAAWLMNLSGTFVSWTVKAALLAGESDAQISRRTRVPASVVRLFEGLFFHVRDRATGARLHRSSCVTAPTTAERERCVRPVLVSHGIPQGRSVLGPVSRIATERLKGIKASSRESVLLAAIGVWSPPLLVRVKNQGGCVPCRSSTASRGDMDQKFACRLLLPLQQRGSFCAGLFRSQSTSRESVPDTVEPVRHIHASHSPQCKEQAVVRLPVETVPV